MWLLYSRSYNSSIPCGTGMGAFWEPTQLQTTHQERALKAPRMSKPKLGSAAVPRIADPQSFSLARAPLCLPGCRDWPLPHAQLDAEGWPVAESSGPCGVCVCVRDYSYSRMGLGACARVRHLGFVVWDSGIWGKVARGILTIAMT